MSKRKQILKQLYDVRPLKADGSLDLEKIDRAGRIVRIEKINIFRRETAGKNINDIKISSDFARSGNEHFSSRKIGLKAKNNFLGEGEPRQPNIVQLGKKVPEEALSISKVYVPAALSEKETENLDIFESTQHLVDSFEEKKPQKKRRNQRSKSSISEIFPEKSFPQSRFSLSFAFVATILLFSMIIPSFALVQKGFETKKLLSDSGKNVLGEVAEAENNLSEGQFEKASSNFEESYEILKNANVEVSKIGGDFSQLLRYIPGISKIATANYLLSAGENISLAGKAMTDSVKSLVKIENPLDEEANVSLAELFLNLRDGIREANNRLQAANDDISKANFDDLPREIQPKFLELKEKLPMVLASLDSFSENSNIILDILGYNGPRKFLFLFQNNQEMRATGGFIGSYGILDTSDGRIKKLFVDDIYNPDGQLTARVIPPEPIQKMSAVWTMHDANWFPDFPTSAEKVAWFYEKTGGPTVDGVIAMTPDVIEKMLSATGPVDMPEYGTTVDEENFREIVQYEVEVDFDKEQNRPKKFIADLTPKILDKLINTKNPKMMLQALNILQSALKEKHILFYSKNYNVQKMISDQGWSGELLDARKDYLSVINSNINGYKTDGVIDETIEHSAQIGEDGNIVDEVTITRKHNGGNEEYDWWNKVNGDWMRVYVPEGSKLLEASGQTREFVSLPLDYQSLQFKKDPQIEQIERETKIDEATGTRIYTEKRKTVFANWVYVSPGETVVLKYKYQLPFKISFDDLHHPAESFSVLYQKQSGSRGSDLVSTISLPDDYKVIWKYPDSAETNNSQITLKTSLKTDKFVGFAVQKGQ